MRIVALLSGGKDSCFNLLHCARNGHELVAAATLSPGPDKEEIDSYMYQTVGQDAIQFVAQALEVPLYRRDIAGSAVEQGSEYGARIASKAIGGVVGDETEDMYELLQSVKAHHPDIEGVSVGAILSNYQRVRVEHVCRRLSLTSLSYLWQRDQSELLSEMIESDLTAVLIKVAGLGLTQRHLNKTLGEMQPTLLKLNALYGSHVCGEGGEYETLTIDSPMFKSRICFEQTETVMHSENDIAPVAYLRIREARLEPKEFSPVEFNEQIYNLPVPLVLEPRFAGIHDLELPNVNTNLPSTEALRWQQQLESLPVSATDNDKAREEVSQWISIANVQAEGDLASVSVEEECDQCWAQIRSYLALHDATITDVAHVNVYLSSMSHFPTLNASMYAIFGTSPPTRACVAVDLDGEPRPVRVRMDILARAGTNSKASSHAVVTREALHVQSVSYWAPANIGPYSQSIALGPHLFISGQIGLLPFSMSFPVPRSISYETALALQHAERIAKAIRPRTRNVIQSALLWITKREDIGTVCTAWSGYSTEEDDSIISAHVLPLLVGVKELPRGALVEVQLVLQSIFPVEDDGRDDDEEASCNDPMNVVSSKRQQSLRWDVLYFPSKGGLGSRSALVTFRGNDVDPLAVADVRGLLESSTTQKSIRAFYTPNAPEGIVSDLLRVFASDQKQSRVPVTPIPARFLITPDGEEWDVALLILEQ